MISVIDEYDGDPHIIIAAIRNSTINCSLHQKWLIAVIEAASTLRLASKGTQDPLNLRHCIRTFADALNSQLSEERNNAKELLFYIERRQIYRKVYDVLMGSAFPYSSKQREKLGAIRRNIEDATGNPSNNADTMIMRNLRAFLDLLAEKDHLSTKESNRFVINSTLEHHIKLIIEELRYIIWDERRRDQPIIVKNMSLLDVVTYVINRLHEILNAEDAEKAEFIFHAGYREIFNKLIYIFKNSGFPFTLHQHQLIKNLCKSTAEFGGNPHTEEFEDLKMKLLEFMDSFRLRYPIREIITTSTTTMIDPNGPVTKAVDYITNGLLGLSRAASDQLRNFKVDTMEPSDLISTMACHFQRIYPPRYTFPQPRAHNATINRPGSSFPYT